MKNVQVILSIVFLSLIAIPSLLGQKCRDYSCVIGRVKKALAEKNYREVFRQLESADGYGNKNSDEIAKLRKVLFDAVENEKQDAIKAKNEAKKQTELAMAATKQAELQAENAIVQRDSAKEARIEANRLKDLSIKAQDSIKNILGTLRKFNNKENDLKKYKGANDTANIFFAKKVWDSALIYFNTCLPIAYAYDLTTADIEAQIKTCNINIFEYEKVLRGIAVCDSLMKEKTLANYAKAYDIVSKFDTTQYKFVNHSLHKLVNNIKENTDSNEQDLVFKYYLLELYKERKNNDLFTQTFEELKQESKKYQNRKSLKKLPEVYKINHIQIKYPLFYDTLLAQLNLFKRKNIPLSIEFYIPIFFFNGYNGIYSGGYDRNRRGMNLNYELGLIARKSYSQFESWLILRHFLSLGYDNYHYQPNVVEKNNSSYMYDTTSIAKSNGHRYSFNYRLGVKVKDIVSISSSIIISLASEKFRLTQWDLPQKNIIAFESLPKSKYFVLSYGLDYEIKLLPFAIGLNFRRDFYNHNLKKQNTTSIFDRKKVAFNDLNIVTNHNQLFSEVTLRYYFHERSGKRHFF
jgi:hypothetical protein